MAGRTRQFGHVLAHLFAGKVGIGLPVAAADVVDHPFKGHVNVPDTTKIILVVEVEGRIPIAVQQLLLLDGG